MVMSFDSLSSTLPLNLEPVIATWPALFTLTSSAVSTPLTVTEPTFSIFTSPARTMFGPRLKSQDSDSARETSLSMTVSCRVMMLAASSQESFSIPTSENLAFDVTKGPRMVVSVTRRSWAEAFGSGSQLSIDADRIVPPLIEIEGGLSEGQTQGSPKHESVQSTSRAPSRGSSHSMDVTQPKTLISAQFAQPMSFASPPTSTTTDAPRPPLMPPCTTAPALTSTLASGARLREPEISAPSTVTVAP
mmetsp:Transcript_38879/g.121864  ORF Transcript_38879/g.121864 Transcript_38879/m.121864 type:complete len:247 (+) Transcript_38879:2-742(+)